MTAPFTITKREVVPCEPYLTGQIHIPVGGMDFKLLAETIAKYLARDIAAATLSTAFLPSGGGCIMTDKVFMYERRETNGRVRHDWSLKGPLGAVHIWAQQEEWTARKYGRVTFYGGVEVHSPVQMYTGQEQSLERCWLLRGPCWHDGTSNYFNDHIAPLLLGGDPFAPDVIKFLKRELADWYQSKFVRKE